ncbi:MAG: hypothetical protein JWO96_365 [Candidatus Saccharibacteria bacterium]|nr:hypothetical protein [Candidatus Saccharibacteria bacterium]
MSERAPSTSTNTDPRLAGFKLTIDTKGNPRIFSRENQDAPFKPLKEEDLIKSVDHSPLEPGAYSTGIQAEKFEEQKRKKEEAQKQGFPQRALWKNGDHYEPVTLVGFAGLNEGIVYYKVEGSDTGLPANQLVLNNLENAAAEIPASPKTESAEKDDDLEAVDYPQKAIWRSRNDGVQLAIVEGKHKDGDFYKVIDEKGETHNMVPAEELTFAQNEALNAKLTALEEQMAKMNERLDALVKENEDLRKENAKLKKELEDLKSGVKGDEKAKESEDTAESIAKEFPKGSKVRARLAGKWRDYVVDESEPQKDEDGDWSIMLINAQGNLQGDKRRFKVKDLRKWNDKVTTYEDDGYEYSWEPFVSEHVAVKVGNSYEDDWYISAIYEAKDGTTRITAKKEGQPDVDEPYEVFMMWHEVGDVEDEPEEPKGPKGPEEDPRKKMSRWQRVKVYAAGGPVIAWLLKTRNKEDVKIIERGGRRGRLGLAVGALIVGAAAWEYIVEPLLENRHGIPKSGMGRHAHEHAQELKHGALGTHFNVEQGHGLTNEIQDYATAHGYGNVSGDKAWRVYQDMREHFGQNLIDSIGKSPDTYIRAQGDVGISNPGQAVFPREVEEYLRSKLIS